MDKEKTEARVKVGVGEVSVRRMPAPGGWLYVTVGDLTGSVATTWVPDADGALAYERAMDGPDDAP